VLRLDTFTAERYSLYSVFYHQHCGTGFALQIVDSVVSAACCAECFGVTVTPLAALRLLVKDSYGLAAREGLAAVSGEHFPDKEVLQHFC
jgi:hypothetical protein